MGARPWVSGGPWSWLGTKGRAGAPVAPRQGAALTKVCLVMGDQGDLSGGGGAAARGSQNLSTLGWTAPLGTPGCHTMGVPLG